MACALPEAFGGRCVPAIGAAGLSICHVGPRVVQLTAPGTIPISLFRHLAENPKVSVSLDRVTGGLPHRRNKL